MTEVNPLLNYPDIALLVDKLKSRILEALADNVVSIYLTGSLSYGGFEPKRSDIDLVVVLKRPANQEDLRRIEELHSDIEAGNPGWEGRIEVSYTPVDFFSSKTPPAEPRPYWNGKLIPEAPYGNEWLIDTFNLRESGITLFGKDFAEISTEITVEDIQKARIRDFYQEWFPKLSADENFADEHVRSYIVLHLCRILYTLETGKMASKRDSADWVKVNVFPEWTGLIDKAESWGYGDEMGMLIETKGFIRAVDKRIRENPVYQQVM